jgi:hypothetical protein
MDKPRDLTRGGRRKQQEYRTVRQAAAIASPTRQSAWSAASHRADKTAVRAAGPGIRP